MEHPPLVLPMVLVVLLGLGLWGGVAVWSILISRLWRGRPVLHVEPRRPAPWNGFDLLAIYAVYIAGFVVVGRLAVAVLGKQACRPAAVWEPDRGHPIIQLFSGASWPTMVACAIATVVLAPIIEELLFRLFLQGWLERLDRRLRPAMPVLGRLFRFGTLPVLLTSVLFAMLHFRVDGPRYGRDFLLFMMIGRGAASLVTAAVAVVLACRVRGATPADLGWRSEKLLSDVGLGLAGFVAIAVPVYALQLVLTLLLPSYLAPDPITLFFFALLLGTLYLRTHRIVPSIVVHMALNGTTMLLLWSM